MHAIKHLEMFLDDESPDSWTLSNFWVTLWKEIKPLAALNHDVTQLASSRWAVDSNPLHDAFKIGCCASGKTAAGKRACRRDADKRDRDGRAPQGFARRLQYFLNTYPLVNFHPPVFSFPALLDFPK
jgi:hypothetical protein